MVDRRRSRASKTGRSIDPSLGPCPTVTQHLLMRAVLCGETLLHRYSDSQTHLHPSDQLYSALLWSYVQHSADALATIGDRLRLGFIVVAPPLLRLQVECLISALWILHGPGSDPNEKYARILRSTLKRQQQAPNPLLPPGIAQVALAYLDEPEVLLYKDAPPVPSIRRMAEESGHPSLYDAFSLLSYETHAGLGLHIRSGGDLKLKRIQYILESCEYLCDLLEALHGTLPPEDLTSWRPLVATFRAEYLDHLRDSWACGLATELAAGSPEEQLQDALSRLCAGTRPPNLRSEGSPTPVAAADAVRGMWGHRFQCVSVRFRNSGDKVISMRAKLRDRARRSPLEWVMPRWRLSCEDVHKRPPLRLVPEESGYLMFPGPLLQCEVIELDSGEPVGRIDVCRRPAAGRLDTDGTINTDIIILQIEYRVEGEKEIHKCSQLLVVQ